MALPYCGNKGVYNCEQARLGPGYRGEMLWASPAIDYLGPGQSSVDPHHGVSDDGGLPGYFKPLGNVKPFFL